MVRDEFPAVLTIAADGNLGFARANNLALPQTTGEAVLLLNPDTACTPHSLAHLHRELATRADAAAVGPTLIDETGEPTITYGNFPAWRYHLLELLGAHDSRWPTVLRGISFVRIPARGDPTRAVDYVAGACMMIKRRVIEELGALDERFFMYFEETDWCLRARRAGYRSYHIADADVAHYEGRAAARASDFALAQFQKSYRLFVAKHYGRGRVPLYRLVQFLEYGLKGMVRRLLALLDPADRERHAALAHDHLRRAALQLRRKIEATPPA